MSYSVINKLKEYQKITGVSKAVIAKQCGLSRMTVTRVMTDNTKTEPDPETLGKLNIFLKGKLIKLEELK